MKNKKNIHILFKYPNNFLFHIDFTKDRDFIYKITLGMSFFNVDYLKCSNYTFENLILNCWEKRKNYIRL